jgi:hypothetical protein
MHLLLGRLDPSLEQLDPNGSLLSGVVLQFTAARIGEG